MILHACIQDQGPHPLQEDAFLFFNDECFVMADGVGEMPHADVAATLACETAIWAYKHIRQRPFYWEDKKRFMKRIFRTVNMTVWQKQRESAFKEGLATTLLVAMIGPQFCWVGTAGDTAAFLWKGQGVTRLTQADKDPFGGLTKALGVRRLGMVPQYAAEKFAPGDMLILATDGVADYIAPQEMAEILSRSGATKESLEAAGREMLSSARAAGSTDDQTVAILKRIA